jgi:hypothetical protein
MPVSPGSVSRSVSSAGLETVTSSLGLYQLLNETAVSALPAGPTNVIPATATYGMRLVIRAYNNTATGTITVAGTAPGSAAAVTETTTTFAVPDLPGQYQDYTTSAVYGAITASTGISVSSLTGGSIAIYGIQVGTRMLIGETKIMDKRSQVSPAVQFGINVKDRYNIVTSEDPEWEFTGPFMASNAQLWFQTAVSNNFTYTTIPNSPTSLLSSTSVATGSTASLSAQPTAPGMILKITLGGTAPATAATVTVTGTNAKGQAIVETVIASTKAQGAYYSKNTFVSVGSGGVAFGSFGTGATITVDGIFCVTPTSTTQTTDTLGTFVLENYDSISSKTACGCETDELGIEFSLNGEAKITAKGKSQAVFYVGNTNVASPTNYVTAPAQEPEDAITGWQSLIYLDNASGTIGSTLQPDIVSGKFTLKTNNKVRHTSAFNPPSRYYTRVFRHYAEAEAEFVLDMTQATYNSEVQAIKRNRLRLIQVWLRGPFYGTSTNNYYGGFKLNLVGYWQDLPDIDWSNGKESVELKLKFKLFYDTVIGYAWSFAPVNQLGAGWAS